MTSAQKILIVDGGISGLEAAVALRRVGIAVEVVEINPKWDVYGVGIIQQANALRAIVSIGLAEACVAADYPMAGVRYHTSQGQMLFEVPQPPLAGPQFPPANGITRPRLHAILQEAVRDSGATVRLGTTVERFEQDADGATVAFADGTSGRYDLVIGADGLNSQVRKLAFGDAIQPAYAGQLCWRYNIPRFPDVETRYIFLIDTTPSQETWPRIPQDELAAAFRERLADFGGPVAEIRDRYITDSSKVVLRPFPILMMPPPWYRGRIVLIGDAAHSMNAHLAQGAAMAIEDAVVLAEELAQRPTVAEALDGYMQRRYERCKALVDITYQMCMWEQTADPNADFAGATRKAFAIAAQPI